LTCVFAEENQIARFDIEGDPLAIGLHFAIAGRDDFPPLRLLFGGVRDDDPANRLLALFKTPNDDPIVERSDMHEFDSKAVT
jgi:hypothetical protein